MWPQSARIRKVEMSLFAEQTSAIDGALETRRLELSPLDISTDNGDRLRMSISNNTEVLNDEFHLDSQALLGRTVESSIWYQTSHTENLSGEESAYGFNLSLPNSEGLFGWFSHKTLESNFNPALGFVNRGGIREYNFGAGYSIWPQSSLVRSAKISLYAEQTNDIWWGP